MSESICKKGDNEENRDFNKGTILGAISSTTSSESMTNLDPAILTKFLHNDTRSSSTDQVDLESNEIEQSPSMLSSSPSNKVATDTALATAEHVEQYIIRQRFVRLRSEMRARPCLSILPDGRVIFRQWWG